MGDIELAASGQTGMRLYATSMAPAVSSGSAILYRPLVGFELVSRRGAASPKFVRARREKGCRASPELHEACPRRRNLVGRDSAHSGKLEQGDVKRSFPQNTRPIPPTRLGKGGRCVGPKVRRERPAASARTSPLEAGPVTATQAPKWRPGVPGHGDSRSRGDRTMPVKNVGAGRWFANRGRSIDLRERTSSTPRDAHAHPSFCGACIPFDRRGLDNPDGRGTHRTVAEAGRGGVYPQTGRVGRGH